MTGSAGARARCESSYWHTLSCSRCAALTASSLPQPSAPRQLLGDIGALNEAEHLTSLGRHLAALPLPPALGARASRRLPLPRLLTGPGAAAPHLLPATPPQRLPCPCHLVLPSTHPRPPRAGCCCTARCRLNASASPSAPPALPCPAGKMLLYGVLFSCLDPVLTVACCMAYRCACAAGLQRRGAVCLRHSSRGSCMQVHALLTALPARAHSPARRSDPWVLPAAADARRQAALVRARLSSDAGGGSDHLATIRAFNQWKGAQAVRRLVPRSCTAAADAAADAAAPAACGDMQVLPPLLRCQVQAPVPPHPATPRAVVRPRSAAPTAATAPTTSCPPPR